MSDQRDLAGDLLRGAKVIAMEIYGANDEKAVRRLYHEQANWPVFQLDDAGVLYALRSRLRAHLEAKSAEKEARIAAASKTTGKTAPTAPRRRRRTHPIKAA
jgi:aspartate oxidase